MERRIARLVTVGMLMALAVVLSGCIAKRINLVDAQVVVVEKIASDEAVIDEVNVHQHDSELEIEVVVRPRDIVRHFVSGQIQVDISDVEELEPPGSEGAEDSISFVISRGTQSQHPPGSKLQHTHFWVRFPIVLHPGSKVRVKHLPAKAGKGQSKGQ